MTPAERGRAKARVIGIKRRLESRQRNGLQLDAAQAVQLRRALVTLAALEQVEVALPGIDLTLAQARARRKQLRGELGRYAGGRKAARAAGEASEAPQPRRKEAREELHAIERALEAHTSRLQGAGDDRQRAQPRRVSSVVNGGAPGLGRR